MVPKIEIVHSDLPVHQEKITAPVPGAHGEKLKLGLTGVCAKEKRIMTCQRRR